MTDWSRDCAVEKYKVVAGTMTLMDRTRKPSGFLLNAMPGPWCAFSFLPTRENFPVSCSPQIVTPMIVVDVARLCIPGLVFLETS